MLTKFLKNIAKLAVNNKNLEKTKEINYEELIYFLKYHQLLPIIHHFKDIIQINHPFINEDVFLKSQEQSMKNLCKSMLYIDFLKKTNPPDFCLAKGFALSAQFYKPEGLRTFNDMDIFIDSKNYNLWLAFLKNHHFVKSGNITDNFPDSIIKKYNFAQHFINEYNTIAIDLHLGLSNRMHPFQFDTAEFMANRKSIDIDGLKIATFKNEYLLVYLLYHAFKHYYFKLVWFIDLYKIFSEKKYNPKTVYALLQKYKLNNLFSLYILIAEEIFGDSGIEPDSPLMKLVTKTNSKYINANTVLNGEYERSNSLNRLLLPAFLLPNLKMKSRYWLIQLFPPFETLSEFYNNQSKNNWFYYYKNRFNRIKRLFQ